MNNSVVHCSILLKFGTPAQYVYQAVAEWLN